MLYLHFYFLADPSVARDVTGALKDEAEIVHDAILIQDTDDLIRRVSSICAFMGGRVRSMVISGHGGNGGFQVGKDWVWEEQQDKLAALAPLVVWFAPDAEVVIRACDTAKSQGLLQKLSNLWGGIKVTGYTGEIGFSKWWIFGFSSVDGERVSCVKDHCTSVNGAEYFDEDGLDADQVAVKNANAKLFTFRFKH
jgi:hypothetical protein